MINCQIAAQSTPVRPVICQCMLQNLPAAKFYRELDRSTKTCGVSGELTVLVQGRPRANVVEDSVDEKVTCIYGCAGQDSIEPEKPKTCSACVNKKECNLLLDSKHLRTCRWNYQAKQCEIIPDDYHKLTATYEQVPKESESEKTNHTIQLKEIHKKMVAEKRYLQEEDLNLGRCGGKPQLSCENTFNSQDRLRDCRWNYTKRACEDMPMHLRESATNNDAHERSKSNIKEELKTLPKSIKDKINDINQRVYAAENRTNRQK